MARKKEEANEEFLKLKTVWSARLERGKRHQRENSKHWQPNEKLIFGIDRDGDNEDSADLAYGWGLFKALETAIYVQDLASGTRERITSFPGINSAPAFSPDGRRLAMTLSRSGDPEIYVMDLGSRNLTQITRQSGIDTAPAWSVDGAYLYFTSDRGGRPQVYRAPASGGAATRVTFDGGYNADPAPSSDGKKIAVVQGGGNSYRIALMDASLGSPRWSLLSPGALDESPAFAPNGSMLVYAGRDGSRGALYVVSADGRVRERLPAAGTDVRDPAWSPYRPRR